MGCSFTVTVIDTQAPEINDPELRSAVVTYTPHVVGTDNCPGVMTETTSGNLGPGAAFPVGTTTESFSTVATAGLSADCSFDVVVTDNEAPVQDPVEDMWLDPKPSGKFYFLPRQCVGNASTSASRVMLPEAAFADTRPVWCKEDAL